MNSGHKMPLLGFGTFNWKAKPSIMKDTVYEALRVGYRYVILELYSYDMGSSAQWVDSL